MPTRRARSSATPAARSTRSWRRTSRPRRRSPLPPPRQLPAGAVVAPGTFPPMGSGRSIHAVAAEAHAFCWDNAIAPALECASGQEVEFSVRDASGGQLDEHSTTADVAGLDFARVNPVSGPVFVKDARPGAVLQVALLELRPRGFGWTAIIPGFGLLADEFTEPWLRLSTVAGSSVRFGEPGPLPFRPFRGTIGVAPAEPGQHSIVPPRKWGGNIDTRHLEAGASPSPPRAAAA